MDEKGLSLSVPGLCEQSGSDTAPLAVDAGRPPDADDELVFPTCDEIQPLLAEPLHKSSLIVYFGTEQRVNEGFTIALRAMGIEVDVQPLDAALLPCCPNREDN
jgi:hypothetical protein